jgi:hypothetical protein
MSKAEQLAQKWFHTFNNHRMLFGFASLLILTACSIYFNFRLGSLNSNPTDFTRYVMPLSYSFLDVSALVLAMCLFAGLVKGAILKLVSWAWFGYLVTLSLFACLSCIIALDAQNASSGDAFKRQQLTVALAQANKSVATWQDNVNNADKFKSKHQHTLEQITQQRDDYIKQISKLDASTPPSQVIFEKGLAIMPVWMDEDQFRLFARLSFGLAMILTPLLLTGVLVSVLGDGRKEEAQERLGKPGFAPLREDVMRDQVEQRPVLKVVQNGESVPKGGNSTKNQSPPDRTGQKSDKYRLKMKNAIINRSVPNLKYSTITGHCGGSKSTAKEVLESLDGTVVEKNGKSWTWIKMEAKG